MLGIRKINHKHRLIMYRLLTGHTQRQIAQAMGLTETWVSLVVNDPLFKEEYQKLLDEVRAKVIDTSAEVQETINAAALKAAKRLTELVDSDDPKIKLKASEAVIDYSDFGRERNVEAHKPLILTQQQMILIEEGLKE